MNRELNKISKDIFNQLYRGYLSKGKNVEELYTLLNENRDLLGMLSKKEAYNMSIMLLDKAIKDVRELNSKLEKKSDKFKLEEAVLKYG